MLSDAQSSVLTGQQLGVYLVQDRIGAGGMGEVYRARDTKLGRDVAIKFLSNELADPAARRRFQREAQMASSLNHPHILTVHDVGEFEGGQYLVTELVDGGTLKDWAQREKRGWREILEVLTNVADGLAAAHQAGILHRDIKPENILLTRSGYAKLADFGLAKLHAGTETSHEITRTLTDRHTRPGIIVGTIAYMSPEQALGHPLDTRSDIFSFGVVLYELLAGRRPFLGSSDLEVLHAIVHRPADRLPEEVPPALRTIVEKALAKDPKDRFQSMTEMVVGLKEVRQATVVPSGVRAAQRFSLRQNWVMAAAAVIIAVAVATAMSIVGSRQSAEPRPVEYTPLTNLVDSAVAPAISPDGRMLAFIRGENTFVGPGEVYVKLLPDGEPVQLTHDGTIKMGPTVFSPDGSRIAHSVGTRETWTVPVLGGTPTRMLVNGAGLTWFDSGGGSRRILFSKWLGAGLHMGLFTATESRADERQIYVPADVNGMIHRSFLSPDATFLYLHAATTRQTYAIPLKPGQLLPSLPASGMPSLEAAADLPGARAIPQQRAFMGPAPSVYAFPRVTTHRNIYSIGVP